MTFDQATQAVIKRANLVGLKHFVLGAITGDKEASIRFENISTQDALKVFIAGIYQGVNLEMKKPMSEARKMVFEGFLKDLEEALGRFNKGYAKTKE